MTTANIFSMFREKEKYKLEILHTETDWKVIGRILKIGVPAALQYSMFSVANLFVQSAVNTFDHVVVEGNSAAMNFDSVVYEMMAAFYVACTSFIAQNYGAGNKENVKKSYLITTAYSFGLAAVLGAFIHIFRFPLLFIFTNDISLVFIFHRIFWIFWFFRFIRWIIAHYSQPVPSVIHIVRYVTGHSDNAIRTDISKILR